jgi:hypothetical protein
MKTNIPYSAQERTEILDEMIIQYLDTIFDMIEKVMDMIELKKELSEPH